MINLNGDGQANESSHDSSARSEVGNGSSGVDLVPKVGESVLVMEQTSKGSLVQCNNNGGEPDTGNESSSEEQEQVQGHAKESNESKSGKRSIPPAIQ